MKLEEDDDPMFELINTWGEEDLRSWAVDLCVLDVVRKPLQDGHLDIVRKVLWKKYKRKLYSDTDTSSHSAKKGEEAEPSISISTAPEQPTASTHTLPSDENKEIKFSREEEEEEEQPKGKSIKGKILDILWPPKEIVPIWTTGIYDATHQDLNPADRKGFKAAGVLPLRNTYNGLKVLLSIEYRDGKSRPQLNVLGGRKDYGETPEKTARREFTEETAKLVPSQDIGNMMKLSGDRPTASRRIWIGPGRYVLWASDCTNMKNLISVPMDYERVKNRSFNAEALHLVWLGWEDILKAAKSPETKHAVAVSIAGIEKERHVPLSDFLLKMLRNGDFCKIISQIMPEALRNSMTGELERVKHLLQLSESSQFSILFGDQKSWEVSMPPLPPASPIQTLKQSEQEYIQAVSELPSPQKDTVVSVRKINILARINAYETEKSKLGSNILAELKPLFHGTPERWRATAIAVHGFDTSIRLHGRASGDGVYTANAPQTPLGYTSGTGSLLRMQGLLTKGDHGADNPNAPNNVFVFRQGERVLPLLIYDFAPSSEERDTELQELEQDTKKSEKEREEMKVEMKKREEKFKDDMLRRWTQSAIFYAEQVQALLDKLGNSEQNGDITKLRRRFDIERNQFTARLPIFSEKQSILKALQDNDVIVLMASTGSGKSTQIPQYLLDDVFVKDEQRRIAVLQPRRVNATSLSMRVAHERFADLGSEVGYRIGLGDVCNSKDTRIEFMTHGLFIQLARNADKFMKQYCAVIVDEAHERTIEIDLTFSILRRAMFARQSSASEDKSESPFKVIVMSATISEQASTFQAFLTGDNTVSTIVSVPGQTYPVHVHHQAIVEPDRDVVGSNGVGKVMSSTALHVALNLIRSNDDGNVLVFLPGESVIRSALRLAFLSLKGTNHSKTGFGDGSEGFVINIRPVEQEGEETKSKNKEKRLEPLRVAVWPFYGMLTRAQRDRVLHPPSTVDRLVIFSTNLAETGLTIPNVRYVIDTGLERVVRFNLESGMTEMVTERITRSAMEQRTGRAGRVAPGICVRLYSKEMECEMAPHHAPSIKTKQLHSTVLRLRELEAENKGQKTVLLTPVPEDSLELSEKTLQSLGAIDDDNNITKEGKILSSLGVNLQLGRFLIACNGIGCLQRGAMLTAILVTGAEALLRKLDSDSFISETGDHLTLLNIFEGFRKSQSRMSWCRRHEFDYNILHEADRAYEHLLDKLAGLKFSLEDNVSKIEEHGGPNQAILHALCAGFFDHLAVARNPGQPKDHFVWLADDTRKGEIMESMAKFSKDNEPKGSDDSVPSNNGDGSSNGNDKSKEPLLQLTKHSVTWKLANGQSGKKPDSVSLAIFGSVLLTDGVKSKRVPGQNTHIPTVHVMSWVNPEIVEMGASDWCRAVKFEELLKDSKRTVIPYKLNSKDEARQLFLKHKGSWLTNLRIKYPSITVSLSDDKRTLNVTAPASIMPLVKVKIERRMRQGPEEVQLKVPENANLSKFMGKKGKKINQLRSELQSIVEDSLGVVGDEKSNAVDKKVELRVDTEKNVVRLILSGHAKTLMGVLIGRIQSALCEECALELPDVQLAMPGTQGQDIKNNPRLMQLSTAQPPAKGNTRDNAMLQLAHAVIWQAKCSVYGGFVRDWVIRGEPANDIDVRVKENGVHSAAGVMKQVAQQMNIQLVNEKTKGAAHTLVFQGNWSGSPIEVDLVDPNKVNTIRPGVDSDAGNLLINANGMLCKKVPSAGGSHLPVYKAVKHVQRKSFVFFYDITNSSESLRRLTKYLSRGWTCLSPQPQHQGLSQYTHLLKPKQKYSKDWTRPNP